MSARRKKTSVLVFKKLGERQDWKCNLCHSTLESTAQVDHISPLWCGGTNDEDNLQILCVRCHAIKTQQEAESRQRGLKCEKCKVIYSRYFRHRCRLAGFFKAQSSYALGETDCCWG